MKTMIFVLLTLLVFFMHTSYAEGITFDVERRYLNGNPYDKVRMMSKSTNWYQFTSVQLQDDKQKEIDLENYKDVQYFAPLFIGEDKQKLTFIFDTGSEWLWVPLNTCTNWRSSAVKYTPTDTYKPNNKKLTISYLSGGVEGEIATDDVRVFEDSDAINMKLLGVTNETNIAGTMSDGILGLTPTSSSGADLLLDKLYKNSFISQKTFGVDINRSDQTSRIVLGGYDTSVVTDPSQMVYTKIFNTNDWSAKYHRIWYQDFTLTSKIGLAVFDTGTSITVFPMNTFYAILNVMYATGQYQCGQVTFEGELYHGCQCDNTLAYQDIGIQLGSKIFFLSTTSYIEETVIGGVNTCVFMFRGYDFGKGNDMIILGDNFFFDYYVYYDAENKQVGLFGNYEEGTDFSVLGFSMKGMSAILAVTLTLMTLF